MFANFLKKILRKMINEEHYDSCNVSLLVTLIAVLFSRILCTRWGSFTNARVCLSLGWYV